MVEELTDRQLVRRARTLQCSESIKELLKRYSQLIKTVANRYEHALRNVGADRGDILDDSYYLIWRAAKTFKPSSSIFSTWLYNCVKYHCLKTITKASKNTGKEDKDYLLRSSLEAVRKESETEEQIEQLIKVYEAMNLLGDARAKKVLKWRFLGKKKVGLRKIAKKLKISVQGVANISNELIDLIKEGLSKN